MSLHYNMWYIIRARAGKNQASCGSVKMFRGKRIKIAAIVLKKMSNYQSSCFKFKVS